MSTKENNSEVAVEKATENNDKVNSDVKGTKRPAEDKTDDIKKAKKDEENGEGVEEILDEEEEELEGEDEGEDVDQLSEADEIGEELDDEEEDVEDDESA